MTQTQVTKEHAGFTWELMIPSNIDTEINEGRDWEPCVSNWIRNNLKPGDFAVDVGANIGWFTLLMSKCVGDRGMVDAYEPEPSFWSRLKRHLLINEITTVRARRMALLDGNGEGWAIRNVGPYFSSAAVTDATKSYYGKDASSAPYSSLDILWEPNRLDLIKIDIDGNELRMLNGARNTIDKFGPKIAMEIVDPCPAAFLEELGYELWREINPTDIKAITASMVPEILTPGQPTINIFAVRK